MDRRLEVQSYNQTLAKRVQHLAEYYISPSDVLYVFPKYNGNILSKIDYENIRAKTQQYGDTEGTHLLLERLCKHENWFSCMLKVLKDDQVELNHVASKMEKIKTELDKELDDCKHTSSITTESLEKVDRRLEVQSYNQTLAKRVQHLAEYYISPSDVLYVFPKYNGNILSKIDYENIRAKTQQYGDTEGTHLLLERLCKHENWFSCMLKVLKDNQVELNHVASKMEKIKTELDKDLDDCKHTSSITTESLEKKELLHVSEEKMNNEERKFHGTENDFEFKDVSSALSQIPGWHPQIQDQEIWTQLKPFLDSDGYYILWYWEEKKRPALTVTDKQKLKTFIIHKRPNKQNKDEAESYFIYEKEKTMNSLHGIVEYHLMDGVRDTNEVQTIYFKRPVTP